MADRAGGFLDGALPCHRYAARIVETPDGLVMLGFSDVAPDGRFGGYVLDPVPVTMDDSGLLAVAPPSTAAE